MSFVLGDPIRIETTKWGGAAHWVHPGQYLGADDLGVWVGFPTGTHHWRPGLAIDSPVDSVTLLPHDDWCAMTFHAPGIWADVYVDLATPTIWEGTTARLVDLDLDVIRRSDGSIYLADVDEFELHRVQLDYPQNVVDRTLNRAATLQRDLAEANAPFDGRAQSFLDRVTVLG